MILMKRDPTEMILVLRDLKWPDPPVMVAPLAGVIAAQVMIAGPMNKPQGQVLWQYELWTFQTRDTKFEKKTCLRISIPKGNY